jgi:hypothetical protein
MVPLGIGLVIDACAEHSDLSEYVWPLVFLIGCHLLDAARCVINFRLADDLIEQIANHQVDCLGSHPDMLLTAAIQQGQLEPTPKLL